MRWRRDPDCDDQRHHHNPFRDQPLRFLWWLDDYLHRRHVSFWAQRKLCNHVDKALFPPDMPWTPMGSTPSRSTD